MKGYQYSSVYIKHERKAMAAHLWARRQYRRLCGEYREWIFPSEKLKKLEAVCKIQSS